MGSYPVQPCALHTLWGAGVLSWHTNGSGEGWGYVCTSSLAPVWWGAIIRHLSSSPAEPAPFQGAAVPRLGGTSIAEDEAMQHSYHSLSVPSNSQGNWSSWQEIGAFKLEMSLSDQAWRKRRLCPVIGIIDKTPIDSDKIMRMPNSADFWCHLSGLLVLQRPFCARSVFWIFRSFLCTEPPFVIRLWGLLTLLHTGWLASHTDPSI